MLASILFLLGLAQDSEPDSLRHAEPFTLTLAPDDPDLEGIGPSRTLKYELESKDASLFLWAEADGVDLFLRVDTEDRRAPSGPAALVSGAQRFQVYRDDDAGGETIPALWINRQGGGEVLVHVAAKSITKEQKVTVHLFEGQETAETRTLLQKSPAVLEAAHRAWKEGQPEEARSQLARHIEDLLSAPGSERSAGIEQRLFDLGREAYAFSDIPTAHRSFERAYQYRLRALPTAHPRRLVALQNFAITTRLRGELQEAHALFEQLHAIRSRTAAEEDGSLLEARLGLAASHQALGRPEQAIPLLRKALAAVSSSGAIDGLRAQQVRTNLGSALHSQGNFAAALEIQELVVETLSRTVPEEHPSALLARFNLATTLMNLGDLLRARALLESVLTIQVQRLPEDHPELQRTRHNLGTILYSLGDHRAAHDLFETVLTRLQKVYPGSHPDVVVAKQGLAAALYALGEYRSAQRLFEEALESAIRAYSEDHLEVQPFRLQVAAVCDALGQPEKSRRLESKVLEVYSSSLPEDHPDLQAARLSLGITLQKLGETEEALSLIRQSQGHLESSLPADHPMLRRVRRVLSETLALMEAPESCRSEARALVGQCEKTLRQAHLYSPREIEALAIDEQRNLNTALSIAQGYGAFPPDPELDRSCFSLAESMRIAPRLARQLGRQGSSDPESRELRHEAIRANRDVMRLSSQTTDGEAFASAVRKRDRLERELAARLGPPQKGGDWQTDPEKIAARLEPKEAALGFWRYRRSVRDPETGKRAPSVDSYLAWVIRPGKPLRRIELGPAAEIDAAIEGWRAHFQASSGRGVRGRLEPSARADGARLSELVMAPWLESVKGAQTLTLAPSDALALLPFDALPLEDGLLGDHFRVEYRQALSELVAPLPDPETPRSLLALGGIDFGATEPERPIDAGLRRSAMFTPLAATRGEVESLARSFEQAFARDEAASATVLTDDSATRASFEQLAGEHRYLHLATHGWFAPDSIASLTDDSAALPGGLRSTLSDRVNALTPALLCGLAFAGANGSRDAEGRAPGVMTAEEISAMDLSAVELCVLSACETSLGLRPGGQAIASLQSSLHAAGVRAAITSLWKVPDEATRELMTEFYRRLWVLKEPKAEALWNAKQKLRTQRDDEGKPVYSLRDWAGWVLSGDPD